VRWNSLKVLALATAFGGGIISPHLASADERIAVLQEPARPEPSKDGIRLQQSMRSDIGLRNDEATVRAAFTEATVVPDKNGLPKFSERAGVVLTPAEAQTFDAYFDAITEMQRRSDEYKAKVGDRATWFRVNNKINDPAVRVGITSDATASDRETIQSFAPKGWRVDFWDARAGVNQVKKAYDRVYDVAERKKMSESVSDLGTEVTGAVYRPYEDSVEILVSKKPSDEAAAATRLRTAGLLAGALTVQPDLIPAAGRTASAAGAKAGIRLGGATGCTSNMILQDTTNNRWTMLVAGHCIAAGTRQTAQDVTHDGVKIGNYRANSAFETPRGDTTTPIVDTALIDLDPGQQTGLLMTVGVPIDSNPGLRGHNGIEYVTGWGAPAEYSGEMMCMEGASSIRDESPYVNASVYRGRMQTVCGSEDGVVQNLNKVRWWGNGFAAGQGWGEVSCSGDSGGYLRRPGQSVALGILSRTPADRPDLVTNPDPLLRVCGLSGYFFSPFKAVQLYANQSPSVTLTAVDGLAMVKSIRNVDTGTCLGRPGGSHYPGFAIVQQGCPAEWRVLPMQQIMWEGINPYGDEVYMIEHWGICLNGVNTTTVNQSGCPGGPGSFPNAFEMQWRLQKAANSSFTIRSQYFSANLNASGSSAVVLGPNGSASRWRLG
jgi:hypothetical protein